jgi:hypothetical protein
VTRRPRKSWKQHVVWGCVKKRQYPTCELAETARLELEAADAGGQSFRCELCDLWHWGHPNARSSEPLPPRVLARYRPLIPLMREVYDNDPTSRWSRMPSPGNALGRRYAGVAADTSRVAPGPEGRLA